MNIGIDVDGTITDLQGFYLRHAPQFFKKKFNRDVVDESAYYIRDMFKCTEKEQYAYWKKYLFKYCITVPPRKNAKKIIQRFHKDGHNIYIISKRVLTCRDDFLGKLMRFITKNWLWWHGIKYNEVVFCDNDIPDSKRIVCMNKQIDIMIDDEVASIEAISPITKVICYDVSYNRECEGENIFRARDWGEVEKIIQKGM
jgi:uncharacterized HAD superfamily protein